MEECPVCMECFSLKEHIPKSLDCRHAVCAECVMNAGGQPLQRCPICRRAINNHSAIPNDLSIIAYLEKNKREKYLKERKEKVRNLIEQVLEASEDVGGRLKNEKVSAAQTVEERSAIFSSYIKHLLEQCQQRCSTKRFLTDIAAIIRKELESRQQELQTCLAACTSLLDNPHVTTDDIDRCESEALNAVRKARESEKSGAIDRTTWNSCTQLVMKTFTEMSKIPPKSGNSAPSGDNLSIPEHKLDGPGKAKPEPKAKYADIAAASSTEQGIRVRALYNYQAVDWDEINFDHGDIITNVEKLNHSWWRGVGPNGGNGLFPANYVEEI